MRKTRQPAASNKSNARVPARPAKIVAAPARQAPAPATVTRAEPVDIRAAHMAWLERTGGRTEQW